MSSLSIKDHEIIYKKNFHDRCKKMSSLSIKDHHIVHIKEKSFITDVKKCCLYLLKITKLYIKKIFYSGCQKCRLYPLKIPTLYIYD